MTRSDKFPVSSFGTELFATLREGANKKIRLKFDDEATATRFRARVNSFRQAMRREKHPQWEELYRCGLYKDPDKTVVVIAPRDSEFLEALNKAGVPLGITPAPIPEEKEVRIKSESADLTEDFLASIHSDIPKKAP